MSYVTGSKASVFASFTSSEKRQEATLTPYTASVAMEPAGRYSSPFVRITFDDGSFYSLPLEASS